MGKGSSGGRRGSSNGVSKRIDAAKPEYISGLPTRKQVGVIYAAVKNDKMSLSSNTISDLYAAADARSSMDAVADKVNGYRTSADYMDKARKIGYDYEMGSKAVSLAQKGDYEAAAVAAERAVNGGSKKNDKAVIAANKDPKASNAAQNKRRQAAAEARNKNKKPSDRVSVKRTKAEAASAAAAASKFTVGSSVNTPAFGKATVVARSGDIVTVKLADGSTKKLMASFLSK